MNALWLLPGFAIAIALWFVVRRRDATIVQLRLQIARADAELLSHAEVLAAAKERGDYWYQQTLDALQRETASNREQLELLALMSKEFKRQPVVVDDTPIEHPRSVLDNDREAAERERERRLREEDMRPVRVRERGAPPPPGEDVEPDPNDDSYQELEEEDDNKD